MQVNKTFKALEVAESKICEQYKIVFKNNSSYKIKIATIERIISTTRGNINMYLNKWKNNAKIIKR
jgi:hypothetical protein